VLARQEHLSLPKSARLFALLNLALADAAISTWDCKYETGIDLWRPITGIRLADQDDNPLTTADPSWEPLNPFTPAFPSYIAGHASFAGAAAAVFTEFFGTDRITHTISTDDPFYTGGPRTYSSFAQEAEENGRSRIYLGVHWQIDSDDGLAAGRALGEYVMRNALPSDRGLDRDVMAASGKTGLGLRATLGSAGATIELDQPVAAHARVRVLDLQGRQIAEIFDGIHSAGTWTVSWNGRDARGPLAPGVFFVLAEAGGERKTHKLVVMK
jgi:hypothetical protein